MPMFPCYEASALHILVEWQFFSGRSSKYKPNTNFLDVWQLEPKWTATMIRALEA